MLFLNVLEEGHHVRSTKVIVCFESREHASIGNPLKVILADVQHGCSQVKLVEEFRNENMHFQDICHVLPLNVTKYIDEPLKVPMRLADPQEVDLEATTGRPSMS